MALERGKAQTILHGLKLIVRYGFAVWKQTMNSGIDTLLGFQREYYELKVEQVKRRIAVLQNDLDRGSFEPLLARHQQISERLFRHKLHQKHAGRAPIRSSASEYKKVFDECIEQYPIVLSTTHSLRNCVPDNFLFDCVIIDESSQVDVWTGALALSCCKRAIIVGETMILSTVLDSSRSGKAGLQFVNDPCMMNVAVSRAQQRFVLVTDHSLFRDYGSEIGDLIRYMEYSTMDGNIVESEIVSVFDLLYKDDSERLRGFRSRIKQRSAYLSENIVGTLLGEILQETLYNGLRYTGQVLMTGADEKSVGGFGPAWRRGVALCKPRSFG